MITPFHHSFCVMPVKMDHIGMLNNKDINSCVYALIQLSGHSPKTVINDETQSKYWNEMDAYSGYLKFHRNLTVCFSM